MACLPGSTTCYASGEASPKNQGLVLPIVNGVPGAAIPVKGSTNLDDVTCPTAARCIAAGERAHFTMGLVVDTPV